MIMLKPAKNNEMNSEIIGGVGRRMEEFAECSELDMMQQVYCKLKC